MLSRAGHSVACPLISTDSRKRANEREGGDPRMRTLISLRRSNPFLLHYQSRFFRQIALSAKPVFHGLPQAVEGHARTNLHHAVGGGQGIVKDRVVREVAHGEIVEPFHGAGDSLAFHLILDADSSQVHSVLPLAELCILPKDTEVTSVLFTRKIRAGWAAGRLPGLPWARGTCPCVTATGVTMGAS